MFGMASDYLAREVTKYLGGDWCGNYGRAPSPGHSKKDRSLTIKPHESDPNDVIIHSFTDGDWKDLKDELRAHGILPERKPRENITLEAYAAAKRLPIQFCATSGSRRSKALGDTISKCCRSPIGM